MRWARDHDGQGGLCQLSLKVRCAQWRPHFAGPRARRVEIPFRVQPELGKPRAQFMTFPQGRRSAFLCRLENFRPSKARTSPPPQKKVMLKRVLGR